MSNFAIQKWTAWVELHHNIHNIGTPEDRGTRYHGSCVMCAYEEALTGAPQVPAPGGRDAAPSRCHISPTVFTAAQHASQSGSAQEASTFKGSARLARNYPPARELAWRPAGNVFMENRPGPFWRHGIPTCGVNLATSVE